MKKALVLLMMLALVVSVVLAGSVYLDTGVSFSNGSRRYETEKSKGKEFNLSVTSLPVEVGYRHVLDNNILISGSVAEYFSLSEKRDDRVIEKNKYPSSTVIKIASGYRMEVNKDMYAEFLAGCSYAFGSVKYDVNSTESLTVISLNGEAGISYEITDSVFLRAGAKLAFPFATNYKTTLTVGSTTTEDKSKMTGFMFNITPFIGASYQF